MGAVAMLVAACGGSFSPATHSGSMTMQMSVPGVAAAALGNSLAIRAVMTGHTIYMRLPAAITSRIPGGRPWWKLDLSKLANAVPAASREGVRQLVKALRTKPGAKSKFGQP